ncbi:unnamed protein product [Lepeophtheirus salmonis]|uniref:(salmon louse) hypothetical protein n=1 Tax=Lepeophtheirus salmonis TaxID=72036 RepID=A0A0K2U8N5_LEPSM|nr:unnamed protein product [Lepeophtheirus salmonis]CAF2818832.1 unnamed protein product [Lepeophtheirus salmonis]
MFHYTIEHVKGSNNSHADSLSSGPVDYPILENDSTDMLMCMAIDPSSVKEDELLNVTRKDDFLSLAIEAAISGDWSKVTEIAFLRKATYYLREMYSSFGE